MKIIKNHRYLIAIIACLVACCAILFYYFFCSFSNKETTQYLYIDDDDNVDSVFYKINGMATGHGMSAFQTLARHWSYSDNIRTGRYAIEPSEGAFSVFRKIKNGMQKPVSLTIPSTRTIDKLSEYLGSKLMIEEADIFNTLSNNEICKKYGYDTLTISCMFIPNTYDIYWNITMDNFLERMKKESDAFWKGERQQKAKAMGLNEKEVITLASIIDEETANDKEKPMVAGMYYNRLKANMPLQADPTIKYALKDFSLKRIYNNMLSVNSPYNTYRNIGLPPGPIRIPTVAGIDAVLNYVHHNYLYMCAREDFSGMHNFAQTYEEHLQNAAKYSNALNSRGIK